MEGYAYGDGAWNFPVWDQYGNRREDRKRRCTDCNGSRYLSGYMDGLADVFLLIGIKLPVWRVSPEKEKGMVLSDGVLTFFICTLRGDSYAADMRWYITEKQGMMRKDKKQIGFDGSITVEAAWIMPVILASIMLLLIMNIYFHDTVIMDGVLIEVLYADTEERGQLFQEQFKKRTITVKRAEFQEDADIFKTRVRWEADYSFPVRGFLSLVVDSQKVHLGGEAQKQSWSMVKIIRYMAQ